MSGESAVAHHPAIASLVCTSGTASEESFVDFLGIRTRRHFLEGLLGLPHVQPAVEPAQGVQPLPLPAFDEEYFEWIDLVEAVRAANARFTMVELGAGYGRWCVRGVFVLDQLNPMPYTLFAVEGEPTHFVWLREHLIDNGIDPDEQRLVQGVVGGRRRRVKFWVGDPGAWYGQAIVPPRSLMSSLKATVKRVAPSALMRRLGRPPTAAADGVRQIEVPSVPLVELLRDTDHVDLMDVDVQGAELDLLSSEPEVLADKVARVHIGTHSDDIETGLRALFERLGWERLWDFRCGHEEPTPFGPISFEDGVQSWRNPRFLR